MNTQLQYQLALSHQQELRRAAESERLAAQLRPNRGLKVLVQRIARRRTADQPVGLAATASPTYAR